MEFYLAQISGVLAWAFLLYSYWKNGNNKIIYLQLISCIFFAMNYYLLGAFSGLLVVIFEIGRDYLLAKVKDPLKVFYICIPIYIIIAVFSFENIISLFSVLASICDTYALCFKNKKVVVLGIITYSLWLIYDIIYASYGTLIAESFLILSNVVVLCKYRVAYLRSNKIKCSRGLYLDKENIKKVHKLHKSNFDYEYVRNDKINEEILNNKNIEYISILDNNDLIGYVNFVYIKKSIYNKIKKSSNYIDIKLEDIQKKKPFIKNYVNLNTITIENSYQNKETINLVANEIEEFIKKNHIHGVISVAVSEFENEIFNKLNFKKINNEKNKYHIYICEKEDIKRIKHTK